MKFCPNCGTQVPDNTTVCPSCNTQFQATNDKEVVQEARASQENAPKPTHPKVINRNILVCFLLSIVTCGIYGIYWYICMVNDVNAICQDDKSKTSGGVVFLLTLVTCGIYGIYWFYCAGKRLFEAGQKYGEDIKDNSTLYLILSIVGLQFVDYILVQQDLNKFSE